jgi:hypothetical protein
MFNGARLSTSPLTRPSIEGAIAKPLKRDVTCAEYSLHPSGAGLAVWTGFDLFSHIRMPATSLSDACRQWQMHLVHLHATQLVIAVDYAQMLSFG